MKIIDTKHDENGVYFTIKIDDNKVIKAIKKGMKKRNKIMKLWELKEFQH
jgi:hypothetical protein